MKRIVTVSVLSFFLAASVVLACGANKTQVALGCPYSSGEVTRTASNVDNGAKIVLASSNPELAKAIQTSMGGCQKSAAQQAQKNCGSDCLMAHSEWTRTVENTDSGVVVLLTSNDGSEVKKIQEMAANVVAGKAGCNKGGCDKKKAVQTASL